MATVTPPASSAVEHASTREYLEALHHLDYSVTIQSPTTSPDGLFMVCAYGSGGSGPKMIRSSHEHLHDAIKGAAFQAYPNRLAVFLAGGAR